MAKRTSTTQNEKLLEQAPTIESIPEDTGTPQTEPETAEIISSGLADPAEQSDDHVAPQTGSEDTLTEPGQGGHPDGDASFSQTEPETAGDADSAPEDGSDSTPSLQTEPEAVGSGDSATEGASNSAPPQTEPETANAKAPGRPRARKKDLQSGSDTGAKDEAESTAAPESAPDTKTQEERPARRRQRRSASIISIDERRTVETPDDKLKNDLLDLVESMKSRKILTGTIQGVERSADNPNISYAVIYHGEFKVVIPADETVEPPADFRDRLPGDVMHYLITKRLGAEVDFVVKGVDPKTGIAAASRLEAMALRRREYYFGTDRDGNYQLYEGICAEARIVSVIRAGVFVDLFGVETYIPLRELSYQRWIDASAHFQPGQRVLVKILSVDRADRSRVRVSASIKQAGENPYEKALRRYTVGSRYVGTVSMVDTNGVFVSLDGGIDCLCSYPKRGRPPRGSRVTVRILGINNESNRIWGAITHMTAPR